MRRIECFSMSDASTIAAFVSEFSKLKGSAERALSQLSDADLYFRLSDDQNSIAVILKHMSGNLRSRFTQFLTADGEKPDRDRDSEFIEQQLPRAQIMADWESAWKTLFDTLLSLAPADLSRTVTIRQEPHTAVSAITRQLAHHAYHVGQIILLAKHIKGPGWQYITIPRGQSRQFNERMDAAYAKSNLPRP